MTVEYGSGRGDSSPGRRLEGYDEKEGEAYEKLKHGVRFCMAEAACDAKKEFHVD